MDATINKSKEIERIVLITEDQEEEIIESGIVISYNKPKKGQTGLCMRFCNLTMDEINHILTGLNMLLNPKRPDEDEI